jgi:hypothetical protein
MKPHSRLGGKTVTTLAFVLAGFVASHGLAFGYAPEPDLMKIKGYSPEIIKTTDVQRSRQEWRQPPAPDMTPKERFFHNIYYNNWTGSVDEFGSSVIRSTP